MNGSAKKTIFKIAGDSVKKIEDSLAVEQRLIISVNKKEIISLYCTPLMIRELVVGLLMTEDIIKGKWCAESMTIEYKENIHADVTAEDAVLSGESKIRTSGCAGGITFSKKLMTGMIEDNFSIESKNISAVFKEFQKRSALYLETGCVHSAALSDGKNIIAFAEDIGRHNAVDKVIGYALLEDISFQGKLMLVSGRLSSEMISKCSRWGISILASRAAPTTLAIEIAEARGITIAGFVRGDKMNVYTNPERIKFSV